MDFVFELYQNILDCFLNCIQIDVLLIANKLFESFEKKRSNQKVHL